MVYYIKQGKNSIFHKIKCIENECQILGMTTNIKKLEKIVRKMKKNQIEQVVLSKQIKSNQEFIALLKNYDITIFNGKWLIQYMLQEVISYLKKKQKILVDDEISILSNDLIDVVRQNINNFSNTYKKIRIVTNHLEKFRRIEKELYDEKGIPIIVTNNKRKALAKAELIVNFDFVQETINQYNINENAIIINIEREVKINKKRFSGTIINDYEVEFENADETSNIEILDKQDIIEKTAEFDLKEILEEKIYSDAEKYLSYNTFQRVESIIKKYDIKISKLYGINGVIS